MELNKASTSAQSCWQASCSSAGSRAPQASQLLLTLPIQEPLPYQAAILRFAALQPFGQGRQIVAQPLQGLLAPAGTVLAVQLPGRYPLARRRQGRRAGGVVAPAGRQVGSELRI